MFDIKFVFLLLHFMVFGKKNNFCIYTFFCFKNAVSCIIVRYLTFF